MRELRQELALFAGLALAAVLAGRLTGGDALAWGAAGAAYLAWHGANLWRLVRWLARPRFRTPVSFGLWERIFDRLQAVQLRSRKRKRDLLELLRRLRLVIGGLADAVVLLDSRGHVRWFNPAAERLLGLAWPAASGQPVAALVDHPLLADQLEASLDFRAVEIPSPVNGAVVLRIELSELDGSGQRLLIARDVTRTHNLERSRKDFVANVSHELRTPLTVFRGYLEAIAEELADRPELAGPVGQLDDQARRMQSLVEDLLDLSRLEFADRAPAGQPVAVPELVASIVDEAGLLAEANDHSIEVDADPELWLMGDAAVLRTAFSNLVLNAVRHTRAGTRIQVHWREEDGGAVLAVSDDGQGIAAYHLPRLTERFYRVDPGRSRESGGTGLGLAIAKHALERHGAELRIESTPGRGSAFTCRFPPERVAPAQARRPAARARARRGDRAARGGLEATI